MGGGALCPGVSSISPSSAASDGPGDAGTRICPVHAGVALVPMRADHLEAVLAIEQVAYSHPWTRGNFVDSMASGYLMQCRVDSAGTCLGYLVAMPGVQEMHLLNLTVEPAHQRRGHAQAMLGWLCEVARRRGDAMLWLEVRESNLAARALYLRHGFREAGRRRGYYPDRPDRREDAVVMSLDLKAACVVSGKGACDGLD